MFGVWAPGEDVAKLTYYGLYALQHRGQEAAGIAVSDGRRMVVFKDLGLVSQVFDEQVLSSLQGPPRRRARRYSTTGSTTWENAQPTFRTTATGSGIALGHNGNLVNTAELRDEVADAAAAADRGTGRSGVQATTDSDLVCELLAATAADIGVEEAAMRLLPRLRGAFSLVFADEQTLYAARDPHGVRPLVLGRLERGWVVASETAALDIVGASMVREVEPGELIAIDADGMRSSRFAAPEPKGCVFEYVYLARPDTTISGRSVHADARRDRPPARPGAPGRGRPGDPDAGVGHARRDRLRPGLRHPLRPGPGQERLRRPHLHPAHPDHPPARHPAQAQPAARRHPGQAPRRGRRLDRARQHPARAGADAARGRCAGGARPDRVAAGALAVLLRHRLRHPRRAGGGRPRHRGRAPLDRRRHARLRLAGRPDRGHRAAAHPAVHGLLRRRVPDPAARGGPARQAPAGGPACARRERTPAVDVSGAASGDPGRVAVGYGAAGRAVGSCPGRAARVLSTAASLPHPEHRARSIRHAADHPGPDGPGVSYAAAGVDIDAGERAVEALRPYAEKAGRPEVLGGIGGFAGLFALKMGRYREPVLAASTDGVGTKVAIAQAMDKHDTIGLDLVAMVVDDLVVCGAEPLFLQDYIAVGKARARADRHDRLGHRRGLPAGRLRAAGRRDGRAPGPDGARQLRPLGHRRRHRRGRRDAAPRPGPPRRRAGRDGLVRACTPTATRWPATCCWTSPGCRWTGTSRSSATPSARSCSIPTRIYARDCLALVAETGVRTFAHITGGGLARNLERVLPPGLEAVVERGTWTPAPVFKPDRRARPHRARGDGEDVQHGRRHGGRAAADDVDRALAVLTARHVPAWVLGSVRRAARQPRGRRPRFTGAAARRPPAVLRRSRRAAMIPRYGCSRRRDRRFRV